MLAGFGNRAVDRAGHRYGRLVAIQPAGRSGGHVLWLCRCDCGNEKVIDGSNLSCGLSTSCGCARRHPFGRPARREVLDNYKNGARYRGHTWDLTDEEFDGLISADCHYCGTLPSTVQKSRSHEFVYNGIDRVDNLLGYTPDNVVTCCQICNRAKHSMPLEDFMLWIKQLVAYQTRET